MRRHSRRHLMLIETRAPHATACSTTTGTRNPLLRAAPARIDRTALQCVSFASCIRRCLPTARHLCHTGPVDSGQGYTGVTLSTAHFGHVGPHVGTQSAWARRGLGTRCKLRRAGKADLAARRPARARVFTARPCHSVHGAGVDAAAAACVLASVSCSMMSSSLVVMSAS